MVSLSPSDVARLEAAVAAAETQTSAEVVLSIAAASDDYDLYHFGWSAGVGVVVLAGLAILAPETDLRTSFIICTLAALGAGAALLWLPLRLGTVPAAVKQRAAARMARLQFMERVAGQTRDANGLLIFISMGEHYVEIIPDSGIIARIPPETWAAIVAAMIADVRAGRPVDAFAGAVAKCAAALRTEFPFAAGDRNEIGDAPGVVG